MEKTISWIALAQRVIANQDKGTASNRLTIKAMEQYVSALLKDKRLTPKQQQHFVASINLHLGLELATDQPAIVLTARARYYWRDKLAAKTVAAVPQAAHAKPTSDAEARAHWMALYTYHGSWEEISRIAQEMAATDTAPSVAVPKVETAPPSPVLATGPARATLSLWANDSKISGNVDYKSANLPNIGTFKERIVFSQSWDDAKRRLAKATNQAFAADLTAWGDEKFAAANMRGHQMRFGLLYPEGDPKGQHAPARGGQMIVVIRDDRTKAVETIAFVDGATGATECQFEDKPPTGKQPNIKASFTLTLR